MAGLVPVTLTQGTTPLAEFTAPKLPVNHGATPDIAALAATVGLLPDQIGPHRPGTYQGGPAFLYIPVTDLSALAAAQPHEPAWTQTMDAAKVDSAYIYTATDTGYRARMFSPAAGIPEDPATGSATAIFAAQLLANGALPDTGTTTLALEQGVEMGRPSQLRLTMDTDASALTAIRVAGSAVPIASGQIRIPD